jgi:hypothetical protein
MLTRDDIAGNHDIVLLVAADLPRVSFIEIHAILALRIRDNQVNRSPGHIKMPDLCAS